MNSSVVVSSSLSTVAERDSISSMSTVTSTNRSPSAGSESLSRVGTSGRSGKRKGSEWEILGNLEKGVTYTIKPKKYEGYLSKRRKWPLKGWHKRYFVIEQGFFTYGKNSADIGRGRTLGRFNIGEAVISANYAEMRIDIDAEESVHHVKLDTMEQFGLFLEQMQQHRLFVQHQSNVGMNNLTSPTSPEDSCSSSPMGPPSITLSSHRNSLVRGLRPARANLLAEMSQQDESLVTHLQQISGQLGVLMDCLSKVEGEHTSSGMKKLFHLRKKKSSGPSTRGQSSTGSDRASPVEGEADLISSSSLAGMSSLSNSNPSLASLSLGRPISFPGAEGSGGKGQGGGKEEALTIAMEMQADLANISKDYLQKRDHIKMLVESDSKGSSMQPNMAVLASLRQSLRTAQEQNHVLRTRLARIHAESDVSELPAVPTMPDTATLPRGMNGTLSYSSSCMSEFFDAREYANSGEDTEEEEASDEESRSETEEDDAMFQEAVTSRNQSPTGGDLIQPSVLAQGDTGTLTGRRRELPVPKTETEGVNLWNLLCKNIGKDLSKISMPVTLNEPLSTLQRLCEELEYSDLVDKAVSSTTALDRMTWVAAFAISAYGSSNARASHKPFNPLLGETYECVREDKGFRYISEQVSHHPPVSCVHATGTGWTWSQALRIRSKFWGKSMEFQPEGSVHLTLEDQGEEYKWNKVTSCIHNLLGQERWVDLYGESVITCKQSGLTARIQFVKASYWSNKRHEMFGTITDNSGSVLQNMFGKWSEALYVGKAPSARCIWRPGSLPEEAELYYGFSRFAVELNEVTSVERSNIPPTDARLRPDQRALEEGRVAEAENIKLGVEQAQRDRRRQRENDQLDPYLPLWFVCSEVESEEKVVGEEVGPERWKFGDSYWDSRRKGFQSVQFEPLW
eukprot:TRINITY_DN8436_c0_g1_i1.p1 TRINITY_DN8436_c0_g1~~TRINITY_DN8436_c0_g1_i1.p1  ORF type:complete len:909 (+),score=338.09 TRINITY_DN8436_c0_g1_i1:70-2796(+)